MSFRKLTAAALISLFVVSGCGGDGGDKDGDSGATPPQNELSANDLAAVQKASNSFADAVKAGDGKKVCSLLDPSVVQELFNSAADCAKKAGSAFKTGGLRELEIETIGGQDGVAHVKYKGNRPGNLDFVKKDGTWLVTVIAEQDDPPAESQEDQRDS